ncbi:hypothetical protein [Amycolatopsis cihanbeyliensis]|uniref:Secreted protein n=1 Tax=Amycolatopsis cihanbeyliensis TaxID=1128664 RepID=A0A542CS64_AMYCI|nr:hypothetical protein [Amycolatopsis cihanbeyliensis]TQI93668.1 hypothetical protein FB471_5808 [Amycolatopsis cihanbeyliensis]
MSEESTEASGPSPAQGEGRRFSLRRTRPATKATLAVAVLVVTGAAVALAVSVSPSGSGSPQADMAGMSGMPGMSGPASPTQPHSDGLSDSERGFRMVPETVPTEPGDDQRLEFRIIGPGGMPETSFERNATKLLHFFVVRDDMAAYQHVHPEPAGDLWRTTIDIPDGGTYRMYAEFVPVGSADPSHPIVLGRNIIIPGDTTPATLPPPAASARAGPYTVTRPDGPAQPIAKQVNQLRFAITGPDGAPVGDLGTYLGAYAHVSAFHTLSQSVTHMHPIESPGDGQAPAELTFHAQFAERGEHRLFLEFRAGGRLHTAAFTLFVT